MCPLDGRDAHLFLKEQNLISDIILMNEDVSKMDREIYSLISEGLSPMDGNASWGHDGDCIVLAGNPPRSLVDSFGKNADTVQQDNGHPSDIDE